MGGGAGLVMGLLNTGVNLLGGLFGYKDKKKKQVRTGIYNMHVHKLIA